MSDSHEKAITLVERQEAERMHPLVRAAMAVKDGLDPATLRELLAVQREWEAGEAKRAYDRAMVELKRDLPSVLNRDQLVDYAKKDGTARTTYRHTSLAAAVDAVIDPLTNHGFSHSWTPSTADRDVIVVTKLTHVEGHHEECTLSAPPDTTGHKNAAQAKASTITLLSRYGLLSLLGIATADMREPTGQPDGATDAVDQARNLKAAAALGNYGKTRDEAEQYLEKELKDWTVADLTVLRDWVREKPAESNREPGGEG